MTRLLADENFPLASIEILEAKKYNVLSIAKFYPGITDSEIIKLANREERLILTFDRDFGQLIFKEGLIPERGIFYFRLQQFQAEMPAHIILDILEKSNFDVSGTITVIEENFIRQKKF